MEHPFSEKEVQDYLCEVPWNRIFDLPAFTDNFSEMASDFQLWRIIKKRAFKKIEKIHTLVSNGEIVGSKIKLPTDSSKPIEIDMLGRHEDGLFVVELKINKSAERNAFSELFAYSNYIANTFSLSGHKDIVNVLIAQMDAKITKEAYLYDMLISDRNVILYRPVFESETVQSLRLQLFLPSDDDFKWFSTYLLSHKAMSCAVYSFKNIEGIFDSEESGKDLPNHTRENLEAVSHYAAQLMESENLHGFCFMRKRWAEAELFYENSLILCALNPFLLADTKRAEILKEQLNKEHRDLFDEASLGFEVRLADIAERTIAQAIGDIEDYEPSFPTWAVLVNLPDEVLFTHNIGFRPTGIMREAYVEYLALLHHLNMSRPGFELELALLRVQNVSDWEKAWEFMEMCGFGDGDSGKSE